jgi:hypothetical protein
MVNGIILVFILLQTDNTKEINIYSPAATVVTAKIETVCKLVRTKEIVGSITRIEAGRGARWSLDDDNDDRRQQS